MRAELLAVTVTFCHIDTASESKAKDRKQGKSTADHTSYLPSSLLMELTLHCLNTKKESVRSYGFISSLQPPGTQSPVRKVERGFVYPFSLGGAQKHQVHITEFILYFRQNREPLKWGVYEVNFVLEMESTLFRKGKSRNGGTTNLFTILYGGFK